MFTYKAKNYSPLRYVMSFQISAIQVHYIGTNRRGQVSIAIQLKIFFKIH
jgi:hypothetical protein